MKGNIYFFVLLSIITRKVRCCRIEDLMKRFFCEDWVIDKRMYGKIAWKDRNYALCTGDLTLKHHEWSRSSSSSLFSRNALEVSVTGFYQTISKFKVTFSITCNVNVPFVTREVEFPLDINKNYPSSFLKKIESDVNPLIIWVCIFYLFN